MDKKYALDWENPLSGQTLPTPNYEPYYDPVAIRTVSQSTGAAQVQVGEDLGLAREVQSLKNELRELKETLGGLGVGPLPNVVDLRDIPYTQAKEEIAEYFEAHHGENIDAADLQEGLGIELSTAIRICEELAEEGKIKALS